MGKGKQQAAAPASDVSHQEPSNTKQCCYDFDRNSSESEKITLKVTKCWQTKKNIKIFRNHDNKLQLRRIYRTRAVIFFFAPCEIFRKKPARHKQLRQLQLKRPEKEQPRVEKKVRNLLRRKIHFIDFYFLLAFNGPGGKK